MILIDIQLLSPATNILFDCRVENDRSEFDIWFHYWKSKTSSEGKVVATEEEALCGLFDLERIMRNEFQKNKVELRGIF